MRQGRKAKPWSVSKVLKTIGEIVVLFGSLSTFFGWIYFSFMVTPQIKWLPSTPSEDHFKAQQGEYRSLEAYLRAQIIVCYGDYQVLSTYVDGYYENEHVVFIGDDGVARLTDPAIAQELLFYIRQGILDRLEEACGEGAVRESDLDVHISTLGGVKYINELGNQENQHCIIKEDGAILDQYISTHINEPISAADVIAFSGRSRAYMFKKFQQELGSTIGAYITECRLREAKSLLRFTDKSLTRQQHAFAELYRHHRTSCGDGETSKTSKTIFRDKYHFHYLNLVGFRTKG